MKKGIKVEVPLLSVCIITYNHASYIKQAIESVLMQKVNFSWELIIADDCSTDSTREIIKDYKNKYPDFIKLILQDSNVGPAQNWIELITYPKSKYIAYFEGDDYWTDPNKLQKQVDFLEKNADYSACSHQSKVIYENGSKKAHLFNGLKTAASFKMKDLLELRRFHTASLVFRTEILKNYYIPTDIAAGDRALFLLCANSNPIKFFSEPMCVYRKNDTSISSRITPDLLKKDLNIVPWILKINPSFPRWRFIAYVHKSIFEYPNKIGKLTLLKHFILHIFYSFSYFPGNLSGIRTSLKVFLNKLNGGQIL